MTPSRGHSADRALSTSCTPVSVRCAGFPISDDGELLVADLLRPGGRLFIREGHPVLWALQDPRDDQLLVLEHAYFERSEPTVWDEGGTYVETDAAFTQTRSSGVESRARGDRDGLAGRGPDDHEPGRARARLGPRWSWCCAPGSATSPTIRPPSASSAGRRSTAARIWGIDLAAVLRPMFDLAVAYFRKEMDEGTFRIHDPEQLLITGMAPCSATSPTPRSSVGCSTWTHSTRLRSTSASSMSSGSGGLPSPLRRPANRGVG